MLDILCRSMGLGVLSNVRKEHGIFGLTVCLNLFSRSSTALPLISFKLTHSFNVSINAVCPSQSSDSSSLDVISAAKFNSNLSLCSLSEGAWSQPG